MLGFPAGRGCPFSTNAGFGKKREFLVAASSAVSPVSNQIDTHRLLWGDPVAAGSSGCYLERASHSVTALTACRFRVGQGILQFMSN